MKLLLDENLSRRLVERLADLFPGSTVVWLRNCDYPTAVAERLIRSQAIRVAGFLEDRDQAVLILMA